MTFSIKKWRMLDISTVGGNIISALKMRNNYVATNCWFFQYCYSNFQFVPLSYCSSNFIIAKLLCFISCNGVVLWFMDSFLCHFPYSYRSLSLAKETTITTTLVGRAIAIWGAITIREAMQKRSNESMYKTGTKNKAKK